MNKQSRPNHSTHEQIVAAKAAADEFDRDHFGLTREDIEAWIEARKTDPEAPCPPAKRLD